VRGSASYTGNPGTTTVNLSGSAAFTSAASYLCVVTDATAQAANGFAVTNNSGSQFTATTVGNKSGTINYICVGN
jgi:hypothetical protein